MAAVGVAGVPSIMVGVLAGTCNVSSVVEALLMEQTKKVTVFLLPGVSNAKSGRLSSSGVVSASLVGGLESASVASCFIPPWWITSKLNSDKQCGPCARKPEMSNW